jgi:hypothetical protein
MQSAQAVLIVVPNASFQTPDVADNTFTDTLSNANAVPNWTFTSSNNGTISAGVWDPINTDYAGSTGNNTALPGAANTTIGGQVGYIYLEQDTPLTPAALEGDLATNVGVTTIASNTSYTLTVALGRAIGIHTGTVTVELAFQDFPLAQIVLAPDAIPANTFTNYVVNLTTFPDYPFEGQELQARVTHAYSGTSSVSVDIDNVRLTADPVPEPTTASMALLAFGATLGRRRRS